MLEIELKFRCQDLDRIRKTALEHGFTFQKKEFESDHYFSAADRNFAITGEAFRLRRKNDVNIFTYKGPKRTDSTAKVMLEAELSVESGKTGAKHAIDLVTHLGFMPVAVVNKERESYSQIRNGQKVSICLDRCDHVGTFVEIEIVAEENNRQESETCLHQIAKILGLTELEPRSYLRMTLESLKLLPTATAS